MTAPAVSVTGVEAFMTALEDFGAKPVLEHGLITYIVIPVTGALAWRAVRTGVLVGEVAPWPTAPPHWIHLPADIVLAVTNAGESPVEGWVSHSRDIPAWGTAAGPGRRLVGACPRSPRWCRVNRTSVAMTSALDARAVDHLLSDDRQEDVCLATYAPSSGKGRTTAILNDLVMPGEGERTVHGNASFSGQYVVRAASQAAARGLGIVLMHSHPLAIGWQGMSGIDHDTEQSYAHVAQTITGHPLVGMTLARDQTWSARSWDRDRRHHDAESVRVAGTSLRVSWNHELRPAPSPTAAQDRTVSAWGEAVQANLARLRILVVGVGTVGLDLAIRLVHAGVQHVSVMDFDSVETINLDRLLTATRLDAALLRSKIHVALRAMRQAATAANPQHAGYDRSVCEPEGHRIALDYDVIFSCVDRPWPRAVLNQMAYSDLIPVIDGGLAITPFPDRGMRNATWRTHVVTPGRPCLQCNGQIDGAQVARDRAGLLDDQTYIQRSGLAAPSRENVSLFAPGVTASMLGQFVSLVVAPGGVGVPDPLRFSLSTHTLEHLQAATAEGCGYEQTTAIGDARPALIRAHPLADTVRRRREASARTPRIRAGRLLQDVTHTLNATIERMWSASPSR